MFCRSIFPGNQCAESNVQSTLEIHHRILEKKCDVKNEEKRKPYSVTIPIEKKITLLRTPYLMGFKSKEKMPSKMTLMMASQLYLQILMACNIVQQNINIILTLRLTLRVLESV